jgi:D-3-phosphoglycerate dehydrogenase
MAEKIALLEDVKSTANEVFEDAGFEVVKFSKGVDTQELAVITADVRALGVRSGPKVTPDIMGDDLEIISVYGVGTDHIKGANEKGVAVVNSAHETTRSVAELVIGTTFSLSRGLHEHNRHMHDDGRGHGTWTKEDGKEVRGQTMGIIGYGAIGAQVSVLAELMGMDVVYYDPIGPIAPQGRAKRLETVEAVLEQANVVSLHTPGGKKNRHLINADTLQLMRSDSYLINAARAELVDYEALGAALEAGQLAGAAIDVYTEEDVYKEPSKKGDKFDHPLKDNDKVLLLPHIGGSTREAQLNIGRGVALKTVSYLSTGSTIGSVNLPPLMLGGLEPGTNRLLNIHDNHPGVLKALTALVADHDLNITSTAQGVKGELGYVAFDVLGDIPPEVVAAMGALKATKRGRTIAGH